MSKRNFKKLRRLLKKHASGEMTDHELERQMRRFDRGPALDGHANLRFELENEYEEDLEVA